MNIKEICRRGYFDKVVADGYMMPMYNSRGLEIHSDESLTDALNNNSRAYAQGIGKLRLNIVGEAINTEAFDDIVRMQTHREKDLKLARQKIGTIDRYTIAYADILILKSDCMFPVYVENKGKSEDDIQKLYQTDDEKMIMLEALKFQRDNTKPGIRLSDCNVAVVDRLFVDKEFRRCGISSWIHSNISDIIKTYGLVNVLGVLLMPGDFTFMAQEDFGMSNKEYVKMLGNHYKAFGYKYITNDIMCKRIGVEDKKLAINQPIKMGLLR